MFIALRWEGSTKYSFAGFHDTEEEASQALKSEGVILDWSSRKEVKVEQAAPTKTVITPKDAAAQKPESALDAEAEAEQG